MSTTDTDALKERIARALFEVRDDAYDLDEWEDLDSTDRERWMCDAAAVLPLVAVEARKAKAEAWDEGAQAQANTYGGQIDTGPNPYRETGAQR